MTLVQRSRKRTLIESQRSSKGIVIREPQEQAQPIKKLKINTTPAAPPVVKTVEDLATNKPTSPSPTPSISIPEHTAPEITSVETHVETQLETAKETESFAAMEQDEVEDMTTVGVEVVAPVTEPIIPIINLEEEVEAVNNAANEPERIEAAVVTIGGEAEKDEVETQEDISARDSTNSAISDKELSMMKKTNPLAAFKLLMSLSSSSTQLVSSSSTTSLTSVNRDSTEDLIRQLKMKVLEGDILAKIGENPSEIYEIKDILQKLHKSEPSTELLTFLVEFGPIFESLSLNIRQRTEALQQKNKEIMFHQEQLNSFKASQTTINDLEVQMSKDEKDLNDWNSKIQRYNEEIKILQTKLANAEYRKNLVEERMKIPASQLEVEATEAIKRFEEAQKHQLTITRLDKELGYLENSITVSSKILDRLKITLRDLH